MEPKHLPLLFIVRLYEDEALWNNLSKVGLEFADHTWGAEAAWGVLANVLADIGIVPEKNTNELTLYNANRWSQSTKNNRSCQKLSAVTEQDEKYLQKIQQKLSIYEKQEKVHDLPDIYYYWSNKYLVPIFKEAGFQSIESFFTKHLLEARQRTGNSPACFVSIGSGNCDLEISIAKYFVKAGCRDFMLECVELNPVMLERGRIFAKENNLLANMSFIEADFNSWCASKKYDGVMANQSLHHVTNLEHPL